MGIRLRHDAAAVVPPSNSATRKYGQQLVLQERQQKYQGQQAGYDRLFDATKQANQNMFQWGRDLQQNAFQTQRDKDQNTFQGARDKALMEQREQEQRRADFSAARGRIDAYAKDVLSDPDLPQELRQRIQNLVSGKITVLGGGFDGPAQQEFLDQYNAQLAAILSEIPPKQPKPPPQPSFHTDENGNQWVESGPGKWEQVPRQETKPTNMQEYYNANEDKFQKDLDAKMQSMQDEQDLITDPAKKVAVTPEAALEQMQKDWEFRQKALGRSAPASVGFGTSSAAYYNAPDSEANSQAGIPIASPDPGQPPTPQQPPALPSNSSSQNPWAEVAGAEQQSASAPLTSEELKRQGSEVRTMDNGQQVVPAPLSPRVSEPPKIVPPDFDKLAGASTNAEERAFLNKMKDVYRGQPPEVQNAISVFLSPNSLDEEFIAARDYLKAAGIDMKQLAAESPKTVREKVQGKMRAKYGENYDSF